MRRSLTLLIGISLCSTFLFFACRKSNFRERLNSKIFEIAEAKYWWQNIFVNSPENFSIDSSSEFMYFLKKANLHFGDADYFGKRPDWKKAFSYNVGNFQCVEAPLIYKNKIATVTGEKNSNNDTKHRIAQSELDKLVFIKAPNGKIDVRIMTITPSADYLAKSNYDISRLTSNFISHDFSGAIQIRKWSEKIISTKTIINGRVTGKVKNRKYKEITLSRSESFGCPESDNDFGCQSGQWVDFYAHVCSEFENYHDESDSPVVKACSHTSGENTWICNYYVCNDSDEGDPIDCSAQSVLPYEDCMCAYWDISYCDNGGGGGDNDNNGIDTTKPCAIFKEKLRLDSLKHEPLVKAMIDTAKNGKSEIAGLFRRDTGGNLILIASNRGELDQLSVNVQLNTPLHPGMTLSPFNVAAFWHNHFEKSSEHLNIFSTGDMLYLTALKNGGHISNLHDFYFGLTTPTGKNYFMIIEDSTKFINFCLDFNGNTVGAVFDSIEQRLATILELSYGVSNYGNASTNNAYLEHNFSLFLKQNNTGLFLSEVDFNTNQVTPIKPGSNSVSFNVINGPESNSPEIFPFKQPCQ